MKPFQVLSPGGFLDPGGIEIVIRSFAELYHTVTPKHKRRLRLTIIEESENFLRLQNLVAQADIINAVAIIDRNQVETVLVAYEEASIFFYPSEKSSYKIIPEALSYGIPILTYENTDTKSFLDNSCGIMIRKKKDSKAMEVFGKMLEMLYFDPEVRKILARGANYKYQGKMTLEVGQAQNVVSK